MTKSDQQPSTLLEAYKRLAELIDKSDDDNIDLPAALDTCNGGWTGGFMGNTDVFEMTSAPTRYAIGSAEMIKFLHGIEFDAEGEYMRLGEELFTTEDKDIRSYMDNLDLESLGAEKIFDVRDVSIEKVNGSDDYYRYTGDKEVPQYIIDGMYYWRFQSQALPALNSRLRRTSIESFFEPGMVVKGRDIEELDSAQYSYESAADDLRGFPNLLFDDDEVSKECIETLTTYNDLLYMAHHLIDKAEQNNTLPKINTDDGYSKICKTIRKFAKNNNWNKIIEAYNSGATPDEALAAIENK